MFTTKTSFPPDIPKDDPPDPNKDREFTASIRSARRNLVFACAFCVAWATAQFTADNAQVNILGFSISVDGKSIPVLLGIATVYLLYRWVMEYAMLPRNTRRWPLGKLDFQVVFFLSRFSLLALAASGLSRSLATILLITLSIIVLSILSYIFSIVLLFVYMPISMRIRQKSGSESVASSAIESMAWGECVAPYVTVATIIVFGIASYHLQTIRQFVWNAPPDAFSLTVFLSVLCIIFISHWISRPFLFHLFSNKNWFYTEKMPNGEVRVTSRAPEDERLL